MSDMKVNFSSKIIDSTPSEEEVATQQDSYTKSGLVAPSLDSQALKKAPRKRVIKENIAALHTSSLERVHQKKVLVQNLAQLQRGLAKINGRVELEELIDGFSVKELLIKRNPKIAEEYGEGDLPPSSVPVITDKARG